MTSRAITLALGLAMLSPACRADRVAAAGGAVAVVDDAGDTVRLPAPARRIVSLIPTTTEILVSAGLGARVVGRTSWCDWPAATRAIPSVGESFPPNIEAVLARRPDLVLLYRTAPNRPAAAQLEALGMPVLELRTDRLADVPRVARLLGRITNASSRLEQVAADFERAVAAASGTPGIPSHRTSVVILAWPDPAVVLGAGAFMSELLERAGGRNAFGDVPSASAPVSLEAIVARNPSAVFLADSGGLSLLDRPGWQAIPAVRSRRVFTPLEPALTRAGLRAPIALRKLRATLTLSSSKALP